jgi:hypothetical protein
VYRSVDLSSINADSNLVSTDYGAEFARRADQEFHHEFNRFFPQSSKTTMARRGHRIDDRDDFR